MNRFNRQNKGPLFTTRVLNTLLKRKKILQDINSLEIIARREELKKFNAGRGEREIKESKEKAEREIKERKEREMKEIKEAKDQEYVKQMAFYNMCAELEYDEELQHISLESEYILSEKKYVEKSIEALNQSTEGKPYDQMLAAEGEKLFETWTVVTNIIQPRPPLTDSFALKKNQLCMKNARARIRMTYPKLTPLFTNENSSFRMRIRNKILSVGVFIPFCVATLITEYVEKGEWCLYETDRIKLRDARAEKIPRLLQPSVAQEDGSSATCCFYHRLYDFLSGL